MLNEKIYFEIGIDHKRNNAELNMEIGSEAINSDVTRLIEAIGYTVEKQAILQEKTLAVYEVIKVRKLFEGGIPSGSCSSNKGTGRKTCN